jgi:hypothetical protein
VVCLVKTEDSRFVLAAAKEIIRDWMRLKTGSSFLLSIHPYLEVIGRLLGYRDIGLEMP